MPSKIHVAALVGALASSVKAHGHLAGIKVDGQAYTAYDPSFQYQKPSPEVIEWSCPECLDNGFVTPEMYTDVTKIACHKDATTGAKVAKVKAGGTINIQWTTWPMSHNGPVVDYLAKVDDATKATSKDLNFFKIDEFGFKDGQWAAAKLIANNQTWTVTIPESIASGQYVLRHEIIALHSADQANGAQNYPKCINIEVEGSGTATPAGVTADKLYTPEDAGIKVNIYSGDMTSYKPPGPALFSGASSGSGNSSDSSPSTPPTPASSSTPSDTSAPAEAASAPAEATSAPANAASAPADAAPATPMASTAPSAGSGSSLPKEFTIDTFIAWLEKAAGSSSSSSDGSSGYKERRHPRAFWN